jgi:O-antigen/teichoic acid export membrane protein
MSVVRQSILWSALERYATQALAIATTAIMARILTPAETGLFMIANAVILLGEGFRDFGIGAYLIQERELDRAAVRTSFTITLLLSVALAGGLVLAADGLTWFYGQPELKPLLLVGVIGLLPVPFATVILSLLRRDLAFEAIARINVAAALTNAVVTVALGIIGFGALSYMWGSVLAGAATATFAFLARPEPSLFRPCLLNYRPNLAFGLVSTAVTVVNMAYDFLPRLALGRILGLDAVGLYARAVTVCQLPERAIVAAIQPVVLPAMAARVRTGAGLKDSYLRGHGLMSAVQWPALTMLALLADPVVRVLLGQQWLEAAPLARLVALATMALAPAFMTYPLLVSVGRVRDALLASLISLPPSAAIMICAGYLGLEAMAWSLLLVAPWQMLVALLFVRRAIGLRWSELVEVSRHSLLLTAATAVVPGLVVALSPTGFELGAAQTVVAVAGGAAGWSTGLWLTGHPLKREIAGAWSLLRASRVLRRPWAASPGH